jgi:site-specific DNA-cytosine methylase
MKFLDLCCGNKGVTKEFEKAGWDVVTVDINPKFNPTIVADINNLHLEFPGDYDLIWASPVCAEYSKAAMPVSWKCNGGKRTIPDMRLFLNCYRIIRYLNPRWWVIENVLGAKPYFSLVLGEFLKHVGSRYLWGDFPIFDTSPKHGKWRLPPTADRAEIRSEIPAGLSKALCLACGEA